MEKLIKNALRSRFHSERSLLSFQRRSFLTDEPLLNFPYKFRNIREFVYTSKETKAESLDTVNQMLEVKEYNLR